jgi:hypothetical protein
MLVFYLFLGNIYLFLGTYSWRLLGFLVFFCVPVCGVLGFLVLCLFGSLFIWVLGSLFIGVFVFYLLVFLFICGRWCITLFDVFIYGIYGGRGM